MIELLSPAGERKGEQVRLNPMPSSLRGAVLGLLDNAKPNSGEFLLLVADELRRTHGIKEVVVAKKQGAAKPAERALLESLRGCDCVITAFAD